jgi:hypothetical protein
MQRTRVHNDVIAILATVFMIVCSFTPLLVSADVEDNGALASAELMTVPGTVKGHVNSTDKDDIYRFEVPRGTYLLVIVQPDNNLGVNLYLYLQPTGSQVPAVQVAADRAATVGISYGVPRMINYTCNSTAASYSMYAWVGMYKGEGSYNLTISTRAQDDADSGTDAGDSYPDGTLIAPGSYKGFVSNADDKDIYKVALVKGDSIYFTVQPEKGLSVNLYLLREVNNDGIISYTELAQDKRTTEQGRGQVRHLAYTLNSKENTTNLFMKVYRDQDWGNYSFELKVDHQNDGGSGFDAGDVEAQAVIIKASGPTPGFLKNTDVVDYYQFNLTDRMKLFVNITPQNSMSIVMTLYVKGTQVGQDKAKHPELELGATRRVNYSMPRTHDTFKAMLKVEVDYGAGNYTISTSMIPKPEDKTAPVITMTDPDATRVVKKVRTYNFKGTATDYNEVSLVQFSFDHITWFNATTSGNLGQYVWNVTERFPKKGNNTIYIKATDDQGNTGETGFYVTYKEDAKKTPGFEAVALVSIIAVGAVIMGRRKMS